VSSLGRRTKGTLVAAILVLTQLLLMIFCRQSLKGELLFADNGTAGYHSTARDWFGAYLLRAESFDAVKSVAASLYGTASRAVLLDAAQQIQPVQVSNFANLSNRALNRGVEEDGKDDGGQLHSH